MNTLYGIILMMMMSILMLQYNSTENSLFNSASYNIIDKYIDALEKNKIPVTIRKSRGKDIDAACGQLANKLK